MTDWSAARREFPAVGACAYLNTAAGGPIGRTAAAAGRDYYDSTLRDGDVHWDDWLERVEAVRAAAAAFVGASARQVAFINNASAGLNMAARTLALESGSGRRRVVAVRGDFPSITLPWLQAGFDVEFVEPDPHGGVSLERLATALRRPGAILAIGFVHYRTGYRHDIDAVGALCRECDAAWVLDVTQGLGALRVDAGRCDPDFLVSSAYKWLNGGYGVGLLVAAERHLAASRHAVVGWRSALDPYALVSDRLALTDAAVALEMGHPPFAGVFALGAAIEAMTTLGLAAIEERVLSLNEALRAALRQAGLPAVEVGDRACRSGIAYAPVDGAAAVKAALADAGVLVSARGEGIRVSAHYYNNEGDLRRLEEALAQR